MLHEILLSLSGHASPLLRSDPASALAHGHAGARPGAETPPGLDTALTPSERALLADLARLSDLHIRLRARTARIAAVHPSVVCRAVGAAVASIHLAAFQRHVLDVEATVLRRDAALVGAYDIVPLTAVAAEFSDWPRRFEWLWATVQYMLPGEGDEETTAPATATGLPTSAQLIDHLRGELQTGYEDIARTARSLVRVAETAWLKQVSAWILYGRLPSSGSSGTDGGDDDFFVHQLPSTADQTGEYVCVAQHLPSFVTAATAASMLFIGRSLVHIRAKATDGGGLSGHRAKQHSGGHWMGESTRYTGEVHLSSELRMLAALTYPLDGAAFARTVTHVRAVLSRTALRELLPLAKVVEMLQVLRDFYLLGRGEFAMALVEQADETLRSRWQRSDGAGGSSSSSSGGLAGGAPPPPPPTTASGARSMQAVLVKDGEVAAALTRTWAMLSAMHGRHANDDQGEEEDEGMELARDVLRLVIQRGGGVSHTTTTKKGTAAGTPAQAKTPSSAATMPVPPTPATPASTAAARLLSAIAPTPFHSLLFSVPVTLTLQIPYPLDLVLSHADVQAYAAIHAYLLSIRRAHIRLTGLWKLSALRRHHPPPPGPPYGSGGGASTTTLEHVRMLRARYTERADALRSVWATTSAAIFFLAEMESYLQMEVVVELWDGFQRWLTTGRDGGHDAERAPPAKVSCAENDDSDASDDDEDIWLAQGGAEGGGGGGGGGGVAAAPESVAPSHDPQSLATAHRRYLRQLVRRLLLDRTGFTAPLYALLVSVDRLAGLVQRLQGLWQALDLETDAGVVDAFVDLEQEQDDVLDALAEAEQDVRRGVGAVVGVLRTMEGEEEEDKVEEHEHDEADAAVDEEDADEDDGEDLSRLGLRSAGAYVPRRVGGLDRLLMKLDFGSWGG